MLAICRQVLFIRCVYHSLHASKLFSSKFHVLLGYRWILDTQPMNSYLSPQKRNLIGQAYEYSRDSHLTVIKNGNWSLFVSTPQSHKMEAIHVLHISIWLKRTISKYQKKSILQTV